MITPIPLLIPSLGTWALLIVALTVIATLLPKPVVALSLFASVGYAILVLLPANDAGLISSPLTVMMILALLLPAVIYTVRGAAERNGQPHLLRQLAARNDPGPGPPQGQHPPNHDPQQDYPVTPQEGDFTTDFEDDVDTIDDFRT
ncbi:hypothetical protein QA600_18500 [Natronococcus sp. A-GB1]|uniref:hypothetical protein n=1 Tax=Natronococcus sp. A-GB1 TaxID=3037648 RepID=UPI00241F64C6|nr:hypothetical protein [Natronococcus sp. A-GB1]MDG5761324.1 hypothetical protein [Natronococcus sp. A-GB1]